MELIEKPHILWELTFRKFVMLQKVVMEDSSVIEGDSLLSYLLIKPHFLLFLSSSIYVLLFSNSITLYSSNLRRFLSRLSLAVLRIYSETLMS